MNWLSPATLRGSRVYHKARRIAREASPEMIHRLVELAKSTDGGRVRSVSLVAVLDRARLKPIDFGPSEDKPSEPKFDPPLYSSNEVDLIEWVLRMMLAPRQALPAAEAEDASDDGSRNWREGTRAAQICSKSNIREG